MAEYCRECAAKYLGLKGKVVLSKEMELCEGCGEYKKVVVKANPNILDILFSKLRRDE